jgi:Pyruvate/2-oxoacid:ferredoxin oxidoreductase gamma subunit
MKKDIILSGVGGQGILSIATVIGKAVRATAHGASFQSLLPSICYSWYVEI